MLMIGIDPGLSGALAFVERDVAVVMDMPTESRGKTGRKQVSAAGLAWELRDHQNATAIVEHVWAMSEMGAQGAFVYGEGFGIILGVLAGLAIRTTLVRPPEWKRALGLTADKRRSLALARGLYPDLADRLARFKDHGRAEALLLAHYGLEQIEREDAA